MYRENRAGARWLGLESFANIRRLRTLTHNGPFNIDKMDPVMKRLYGCYIPPARRGSTKEQVQQHLAEVVQKPLSKNLWKSFSCLAHVAGCGLVVEHRTLTLYGRKSCLDLLQQHWLTLPTTEAKGLGTTAQRTFQGEWNSTAIFQLEQKYWDVRKKLHPMDKIAHKVAGDFPHLRIWPKDEDFNPYRTCEVQLREHDGGDIWIGGIFHRKDG